MPVVPTLNNNPIQSSPFPNVQSQATAPLEAFGGGRSFATGIEQSQQIAAPALKFAEEEMRKADETRTKDAYNQATSLANNLQWDPDSGFTNTRGKDSFGIINDYGSKLKTGLSDIENSLDNHTQKEQFKLLSGKLSIDFNENMQRHVGVESRKYSAEVNESGIAQAKNYAVLNYQTPGAIASSLETQKTFIESHGKENGLPRSSIDGMILKAASNVHHDVIERMSDTGQDILASNYFKNNKANMTADDIVRVEKTLEESSTLGEAQRKSDKIISQGLPQSEAFDKARAITNPKVREKSLSLLDKYYSDQKKAQDAAQVSLFNDTINILDKTKDYDALPASTKAALTPQNKKFAQEYAKGSEPAANGSEYQTLKLMSTNADTREQFANMPLSDSQKSMTRSEWKELFDTQTNIRQKDGATSDLLDYQDGNQKVLRNALQESGIAAKPFEFFSPTTWFGGSDGPALIRYQNDFNQAVKTKEEVVGRKLTTEEASGIANKLTSKIVTENGVRKITPLSQSETVSIDDIPKNYRTALSQELQNKGWPVTEENMIKFYLKAVQSGAIKPNAQ